MWAPATQAGSLRRVSRSRQAYAGQRPAYDPDIFSAATLVASRKGVSVDVALARLHRSARAAGISPLAMATLVIHGRGTAAVGD